MPQPVATRTFPFTAIVGQEPMKVALCLNAVNPAVGGVLIRGLRGTAKSTAVRGLARLLPGQQVVAGCPFGCDPAGAEDLCPGCRRQSLEATRQLPAASRRMRVVELPINASLDRVVGTIDMVAALRDGARRFQPGLLAEANRNILYVDEVNLLDDCVADVLLDAAALGVNVIEREGISLVHPARFMLVGTMNPEEGDLRPQLLDRFGLCVDVGQSDEADERIQIAERDAAFRSREGCFQSCYEQEDRRLAAQIESAVKALPSITVSREAARLISAHCVEAGTRGHRADVAAAHTARALAAFRDHASPTQDDVYDALELVLAHRSRTPIQRPVPGGEGSDMSRDADKDVPSALQQGDRGSSREGGGAPPADRRDPDRQDEGIGASSSARPDSDDASPGGDEAAASSAPVEATDPFSVHELQLRRLRRPHVQSGKRLVSMSTDRRGRYVRAEVRDPVVDLAVDATLRAAAPYQSRRGRSEGGPLRLERHDLRQKVRERKVGNLTVFVVDASASMNAEQRMAETKGAILSLLHDAYVRRDRVALVIFKDRSAQVVLPPTSSVSLARRQLAALSIGGTTPLAHGLAVGYNVIRTAALRDPSLRPLLVLISDGEGNVAMSGGDPAAEARKVADLIASKKIDALVIDSTRTADTADVESKPTYMRMYHHYAWGTCADLARRMHARYFGLHELPKGQLAAAVIAHLKARV